MNLLTIAQAAAEYAGVNVPATIAGNADETAVRLLSLAKVEALVLSRVHDWTVLQRLHTFSTAIGDSDYALPDDYGHMLNNTQWNRSETDPMVGPVDNRVWQEWQSGILTPIVNDNWRLFPTSGTTQFHIEPTPTAVETIAFEYVSNAPVESAGGDAQGNFVADLDIPRIPDHLVELGVIWRLLSRMGFAFAVERTEYMDQVSLAIARDGGTKVLSMGGARMDPRTAAYTPEAGYG